MVEPPTKGLVQAQRRTTAEADVSGGREVYPELPHVRAGPGPDGDEDETPPVAIPLKQITVASLVDPLTSQAARRLFLEGLAGT